MASSTTSPTTSGTAAATTTTPQQLFAQGVHAAFAKWEVLQAAIDGSWGGRDTKAKAEWLEETVIEMFSKGDLHPEDLEYSLDDIMMAEFHAEVRDGSLEHTSRLLCQMYRDTRTGKLENIQKFIASCVPAKPQNAPALSESEGEDEDDDGEAPMLVEATNGSSDNNAQAQAPAPAIQSPPSPPSGPDEEGWEVVKPKKRGGRR